MTTILNTGFAHCLHHEVHFELCRDFEERVQYIRQEKPFGEQAIRLANFWLFPPSPLPPALEAAMAEWKAARVELDVAMAEWSATVVKWEAARVQWSATRVRRSATWVKLGTARVKVEAARVKVELQLLEFHDRLVSEQGYVCTWNGQSIFKEMKGA